VADFLRFSGDGDVRHATLPSVNVDVSSIAQCNVEESIDFLSRIDAASLLHARFTNTSVKISVI